MIPATAGCEDPMDRRKFLLGVGGASIGGSALLGSGAFSRVESQRSVEIAVAQDPDAYLGLKPLDTPNSQNYVALDDDGHLYIQIDGEGDQQDVGGDGPIGQGVNSDSRTWFDGMFEICNQGKEDACISWEFGDDFQMRDEAELVFYYDGEEDGDPTTSGRMDVEEGRKVPLALGECATIGLRTETFDVDATGDDPLFDGEIKLIADVDGDCFVDEPVEPECPEEGTWDEIGDEDQAGGPVIIMGLDSELGSGRDYHGPPEEHAEMVATLLGNVSNGQDGILVLGGDPTSYSNIEQYWEDDIGSDPQVDENVDFIYEIEDIKKVDLGEYAMIGVVSGTGQIFRGLTDDQNDELIDRRGEIADFVNNGGGLLVKTQDGLSDPAGLLDPFGEFDGMFGIDGPGYGDAEDTIEITQAGEDFGLDAEEDEDGLNTWESWCCWHDVYTSYPEFLDVLAWNTDSTSDGVGHAAALGGAEVIVPREVALKIFSGMDTIEIGEQECYDLEVENRGEEDIEGEFDVELVSTNGSVEVDLPETVSLEGGEDGGEKAIYEDAICVECDAEGTIEVDVELLGEGGELVDVTMVVECVEEIPEEC